MDADPARHVANVVKEPLREGLGMHGVVERGVDEGIAPTFVDKAA